MRADSYQGEHIKQGEEKNLMSRTPRLPGERKYTLT